MKSLSHTNLTSNTHMTQTQRPAHESTNYANTIHSPQASSSRRAGSTDMGLGVFGGTHLGSGVLRNLDELGDGTAGNTTTGQSRSHLKGREIEQSVLPISRFLSRQQQKVEVPD